ncbi:hypothetical protein TSAR_006176 [Trichomalopsis sarcophagae]|uniref:Uncharacterized protein n=1 Tax=Trichomalopsis sarcophagae TaxID=543379 RepID=A0A232ED25_9HYME|nr:hypothetical protein TSAR_006176 [Trichomalopsis sarcophagae]
MQQMDEDAVEQIIEATPNKQLTDRRQKYRDQNREEINRRRRERYHHQKNMQQIDEDAVEIIEATPKKQQRKNDSNLDIIQEISHDFNSVIQQHNTQDFQERHNIISVHNNEGRNRLQTIVTLNAAGNSNIYSSFQSHKFAHKYFNENFISNEFGHACSICDRLWLERDLKKPLPIHENIINKIFDTPDMTILNICSTCKSALDKNKIPNFSVYNGFHYLEISHNLPKIDFLTERLLSPRIPFMQIRRLRHFCSWISYHQIY